MDGKIKKNYSEQFKLKVAIAALKANKTVSELCQEFAVNSARIYEWKKQLEENGVNIFSNKSNKIQHAVHIEKLYKIIGKLVVDNEINGHKN